MMVILVAVDELLLVVELSVAEPALEVLEELDACAHEDILAGLQLEVFDEHEDERGRGFVLEGSGERAHGVELLGFELGN